MLSIFDIVADRREQIEKSAMLGAVTRLATKVGKSAFKNPMKTLGVAGTGFEVQQGFSSGSRLASQTKNIAKVHSSGPKIRNQM